METKVDEIAEGIYRLSTFLPAVGPRGFTFNQDSFMQRQLAQRIGGESCGEALASEVWRPAE